MQFLVTFEVFESITSDQDVKRVRDRVGKQGQEISKSGKVKASGIFADARGGFFLVDVGSSDELHNLLGAAMLDQCHVKARPIVSFETLEKFFRENPIR